MIAVVAVHRIVGRLSTRLRQELGVCQGTQSSVPTLPSEEHPSEQRPSQKSGRHTYPYNTVSDHIFRRYVQLELSGSSKSEQEHKEGRPQSHGSFLRVVGWEKWEKEQKRGSSFLFLIMLPWTFPLL